MGRNRLADTGKAARLLAGMLDGVLADVAGRECRLGTASLGPCHAPPVAAQRLQQLGREHDVAIFLSLALFDTDDHALAVDVGGLQADGLGDAQAGGVAGGQDRAMLECCRRSRETGGLPPGSGRPAVSAASSAPG